MGHDRTTTVVERQGTQTTTPEKTQAEKELEQIQLGQVKAADPLQRQVTEEGLSRVLELFKGENLPGFFGEIGAGISPELTSEIAGKAVSDIAPSFQQSGILDSGVAAAISGQVAGDIRRGTAEFNQGNKLNLLNLALGGQAQIQQPLLQQTQLLSGRLAGLRPITTSFQGSSNQTVSAMNPFLKSFQTSLGEGLGGGLGGRIGGGFPLPPIFG